MDINRLENISLATEKLLAKMPQADPTWLAQLEKVSLATADPAWLAQLEKVSLTTDKLLAVMPQVDPAWLARLEKVSLATADPAWLAQLEKVSLTTDKLLAVMPQAQTRLATQLEKASLATDKLLAKMPQADPAWLAQLEKVSLATADPAWLAQLEKGFFRDLGKPLAEMPQADPAWLAQLEKVSLATDKLLAEMPPLTPELFGETWNERVAEAVERLERTGAFAEDVDAETDPHRAVEALDKDAATVQEAAPDEAQERVNTRLSWLRVRQGLVWFQNVYAWIKMLSDIFGVPIPDLSAVQELLPAVQELPGVRQPARPPVPALDLPTTGEIEPITNPKPPGETASS